MYTQYIMMITSTTITRCQKSHILIFIIHDDKYQKWGFSHPCNVMYAMMIFDIDMMTMMISTSTMLISSMSSMSCQCHQCHDDDMMMINIDIKMMMMTWSHRCDDVIMIIKMMMMMTSLTSWWWWCYHLHHDDDDDHINVMTIMVLNAKIAIICL